MALVALETGGTATFDHSHAHPTLSGVTLPTHPRSSALLAQLILLHLGTKHHVGVRLKFEMLLHKWPHQQFFSHKHQATLQPQPRSTRSTITTPQWSPFSTRGFRYKTSTKWQCRCQP